MNEITKTLLLLAVAMVVLLGTNRYSRRYDHTDPFGMWLKGNGKMLRDYDAERKQIEDFMR